MQRAAGSEEKRRGRSGQEGAKLVPYESHVDRAVVVWSRKKARAEWRAAQAAAKAVRGPDLAHLNRQP